MSQTAENKSLDLQGILEILRSQALSIPTSATSARYLRALDSLESSVFSLQSSDCGQALRNTAQSADTEPTAPILQAPLANTPANDHLSLALTDWLVNQWLMNTPFATFSLYLDIISSLYGSAVKTGILPSTKIFSQIKASLKALGSDGWKSGINDEIFARALRLTKNAVHLISDDAIAASLVIWSLTHGLMPFTDIAQLKKSDFKEQIGDLPIASKPSDSQEQALILWLLTINPSQRMQYMFPLRQSSRTPKQLSNHISKIVNDLFRRARLPQATDPFQTVEALWAYAALRAGIPASQLVSYLGHVPLGLPILRLCKSSVFSLQSSENEKNTAQAPHTEPTAPILRAPLADTSYFKENFANLGKIFLENPPLWYAMSLRPGVRFTQVCRRLELLLKSQDSRLKTLSDIQLFYPCEEIARAVGKKIVTRQRPFIPSVVFFRAKLTDIGPLFSKIGDLAWCYRQSSAPGAPYASISQKQFDLFQRTIASFTPDFEVAPSGELELRPNDRVRIIGGLFSGHEATFEGLKVKGQEPRVKDQESRVKSEEPGYIASQNANSKTESHNTPGVVYRLNIIGDNGIEWRINVDPRLTISK